MILFLFGFFSGIVFVMVSFLADAKMKRHGVDLTEACGDLARNREKAVITLREDLETKEETLNRIADEND